MAERLVKIAAAAKIPLVFKASYDKANRSSISSYRGPGLRRAWLCSERSKIAFAFRCSPIFMSPSMPRPPPKSATFCRCRRFFRGRPICCWRRDARGRVVNLKKGQFLSPWEMANAVKKVESTGNRKILLTERGVSFGYHNLVVDMRSFPILAKTGYPVVFDVTHSVQLPGGQKTASGGQPEFIEPLARAGCAAGVDAIFLEVHDRPARALSDGSNALPLDRLPALLRSCNRSGSWCARGTRDEPGNGAARAAHRGPSHRRIAGAARRDVRSRRGDLAGLQRARRGDGDGQVGPDRPENCRHVFVDGHAFGVSCIRPRRCTAISE